MKEIRIPFGKSTQVLHIEEARLNAVIDPKHPEGTGEKETDLVQRALENPIGTPRLRELVKGKQKILVITSDHTRPVPSRVTMPLLLKEIRSGNPDAEITLLIATGMHRPTTRDELIAKLGEEIVLAEKIVVHRAADMDQMAFFGTLPSGGELWLNRLVKEADLVVSEGFIEPHFFAGFSGGRKSILPGVASAKTVLYNHNSVFIRSEHARQGSLDGNPIHRDMLFAAQQARLAFILNVIIDDQKKVIAAFAGDQEQAHRVGCRRCEEMSRQTPVKADIAISSNGGYPLDQNVYQSVKGMTAAEACVKQGGAIIMNAALGDGAGGDDFYHWFADRAGAASVTEAIEKIPPESTLMDQWEAQILARIMGKATCWFVSGPENKQLLESMHFRWAPDTDTALKEATELLGANATVTVIPDGVSVIL